LEFLPTGLGNDPGPTSLVPGNEVDRRDGADYGSCRTGTTPALWADEQIADSEKPNGYILSLEGADSLVNIDYMYRAYEYGLHALGL